MKRRYSFLPAAALLLAAACSPSQPAAENDFTRFVDPKIGTGGHGHVFVGANVPFGMVQVGPTSIPQEWDWVSGYHRSDSTVIGFSHTHLSGTGIGDLFDVTVMPVVGEVTYARGTEDDPSSGLWSYADRTREIVRPGYYSVPLTRYGSHGRDDGHGACGTAPLHLPGVDAAAVVFDLENGGCWDEATDTGFRFSDDSTRISGWRYSTGWAKDQRVYFAAEFSKPFAKFETVGDKYARASFSTTDGEQLLVKVALSPVSVEGAEANLDAELPEWDFEATAAAADKAWNDELSKVKITTEDETAKRIFYTGLYHTMVAPSVFCDVNGDYRGSDYEIHRAPGFTNYTTFSLWDTYRAAMPLMTILHPERMPDIVRTMLAIADEQGRLPVWHLWGNETDCMVGNPGIPVVADAIVKGIEGFDREKAFEAIKKTAMNPDRGNGLRMSTATSRATCSTRRWPTTWSTPWPTAPRHGPPRRWAGRRRRTTSRNAATLTATASIRRRASCGAATRREAGARRSTPSPRRTVPTTTARETPGSTRGSCRTTSRGSSGVSAAARRCSESSIRSSR